MQEFKATDKQSDTFFLPNVFIFGDNTERNTLVTQRIVGEFADKLKAAPGLPRVKWMIAETGQDANWDALADKVKALPVLRGADALEVLMGICDQHRKVRPTSDDYITELRSGLNYYKSKEYLNAERLVIVIDHLEVLLSRAEEYVLMKFVDYYNHGMLDNVYFVCSSSCVPRDIWRNNHREFEVF